ncbi:MAG: hypothetical protein PHP64_06570 [Actinomycetota bacterium]|nr:hypothetical protein [Actinomycetota bacterium]
MMNNYRFEWDISGKLRAALFCALLLILLFISIEGSYFKLPIAKAENRSITNIEYWLKLPAAGADKINVRLKLKINDTGDLILKAPLQSYEGINSLEIKESCLLIGNKWKMVSLEKTKHGWMLRNCKPRKYEISYDVRNVKYEAGGSSEETSNEELISDEDVKLVKCSNLFILPDVKPKASFENLRVHIEAKAGTKVVTPWKALRMNSFDVESRSALIDNFIAWGKLSVSDITSESGKIVVAVQRNFWTENELADNAQTIKGIFSRMTRDLGQRGNNERVVVIVRRVKNDRGISFEALRDSIAISTNEKKTNGSNALLFSRALFALWNDSSILPKTSGNCFWFHEGTSILYPLKVSVIEGIMTAKEAEARISSIYESSLQHKNISILEAESKGQKNILKERGTLLCMLIDRRLRQYDKSIEWLLKELARKKNYSKGEKYTLMDIEEIIENGTKKSWDRFLDEKLNSPSPPPLGDFMEDNYFDSQKSNEALSGKKSSTSSIVFLLISILVVFSVPLISEKYVRNAVKLDIEMPKILPDDLEE